MKKIFILIISFVTLQSCSNVLEIDDLQNFDPEQVWNDQNLANAFLANLYPQTFGNWNSGADRLSEQLAGIEFPPTEITVTNGAYEFWHYGRIRLINQAIVDVSNGSLTDSLKNQVIGQALFLRAYTYFTMVTYYGGVPYITTPQDRFEDDLYVPRNPTLECFELIDKDLKDAIAFLPERIEATSEDYGRIDGNFAKAFRAKVLLYKASPQFNPSRPWDNAHWRQAYSANKEVYQSLLDQGYGLVSNYSNIALEERNSEVIFSVINQYPNKVGQWDNSARPGSESRGAASACPTWEFVKEFPMKDGRLYNDRTGKYFKTDNQFLQSFWENRDPRFDKSIVWNAKLFEISNKTGRRQYTGLGIAHELDDFGINPNAGINSTNLDRYTGFYIQKNILFRLTQGQVDTQYDVDFVLMRLAEVMLNYAEAANETGNSEEALEILRLIRQRAGIEPGANRNYGITARSRTQIRQAVIDERNIEFCFEGMRFWDLRRLRMLSVLDGKTKSGIEAIAVNPNGREMPLSEAKTRADRYQLTEENFEYSVLQVPRAGVQVNELPKTYYFFPIQQNILDRNPKLEQNDNWGGSFNPTLEP